MKRIIITFLLLTTFPQIYSQDYIKVLSKEVCKCIEAKDDMKFEEIVSRCLKPDVYMKVLNEQYLQGKIKISGD